MRTDLDSIKARLSLVTPGPWRVVPPDNNSVHRGAVYVEENGKLTETIAVCYCGGYEGHGLHNAELFAHAPEDLSSLIGEVEGLREELDRTEHARSSIVTAIMLEVQKERAAIVKYLNLVYGANVAAQEIERGNHHQDKE